ncbi:adhesion G protein-coupled receptor E5-like [Tribolium madens]|uniref:adhesion G protein-coupled receptor E5-like n=1 Tax=Tribolium madens TaxID=41895 RepID=UPI001CF75846|nr:adhesion G protein-coupled receptor E5-like [Tribolium madens]
MNIVKCLVGSFCLLTAECMTNMTLKRTVDDDYYMNYDYETNDSINSEFLLPNPENLDSVDVLPNVELPDDSLSDTDLKDHDFIDNLMYVYYGSHNSKNNSYGPQVIIVGSVISCAAQLLTICFVLLKKTLRKKETKSLFLHTMCSFSLSNLLFMLGVYAKNSLKCLLVAFFLHYLHLLTAFWMFLYCYYIYKRFSSSGVPKNKYFLSVGYGTPLVFSLISYTVSPNSLETKRFCFMSVQKGMIINYMLPISLLIVVTTIYSLNGIRKINIELSKLEFSSSAESLNALKEQECDEEVVSLRESKTCLKLMCVVQTGYDIVWFIVVLALESNSENNSMSIVYSVTSCLLNWYIFIKAEAFLPNIMHVPRSIDNVVLHQEQQQDKENSRGSSDSVPLLINTENCTEMRELRLEYISTISS